VIPVIDPQVQDVSLASRRLDLHKVEKSYTTLLWLVQSCEPQNNLFATGPSGGNLYYYLSLHIALSLLRIPIHLTDLKKTQAC
jgi:hypothetical protein